jgi:uncharacterized protein (DUF1800 family)
MWQVVKKIINALLPLTVLLAVGCSGGTTDLTIPAAAPALPATEVANAAPDGPLSPEEAWRLLDQTTFGARLDDINSVAVNGPEWWINRQMALPANYMLPALQQSLRQEWNEYVNTWWRLAIKADDQLRQRVAFALSEIFVVSAADGLGNQQPALANYYDILLRHSFGNYRDLLKEITLSPVMGEYLSMKGNHKPDPENNIRPDENYAREILQLFSIGLVKLNPNGTPRLDSDGVPLPSYDQDIVEGYAHVFTGWHFANAERFRWAKNKDYINPMVAWPDYHDTAEKRLLNDVVLPAGQTPEQDLDDALDSIANHPNVGPFIAKQLIQRLVTSNPSPTYVKDVAAVFDRNAAGERGALGSTIKAILMHKEARLGHNEKPTTFGKLREPLLRVTQLWRAFETDRIPVGFTYAWVAEDLAQAPLNSPSVFNFFRPDYSHAGAIREQGLVSPEFEILDETTIIKLTSRLLANSIWLNNYKADSDGQHISIDISREMQIEPDAEALLDHLDLLLLGGRMSTGLRDAARELMAHREHDSLASLRVAEAIFLIITSPEAAVQI